MNCQQKVLPFSFPQVDKFRNSTGYTPRPSPIALNLVKPSLPDIVLPILGRAVEAQGLQGLQGHSNSPNILPSGSPGDFTRSPPPAISNGPLTR